MKLILLPPLVCIFTVFGCDQSPSESDLKPSEVYQRYYATVANGMSFDEDAAYHSKSKQADVKDKLDSMRRSSEQTSEQIIALYLNMSQQAAQCSELILNEERIEGKTAHLVFDRKDVCGDGEIKQDGEEITMIYENGWKIHDSLSRY